MSGTESLDTIFVGAGASGIGPLVHAAGVGRLDEFLREPVAVLDSADEIGAGSLGDYLINTNSRAANFLECLEGKRAEGLPHAARSAAAASLRAAPDAPASMQDTGDLLRHIGLDIQRAVQRSDRSRLVLGHAAREIRLRRHGRYAVVTEDRSGRRLNLAARRLVLATGAAAKPTTELASTISDECRRRGIPEIVNMHSGEMLTQPGLARAAAALRSLADPQVLIVGGGDSAFSAAWLLLRAATDHLGDDAIVIAHRSTPKVAFETTEEARLAGYASFTDRDVCPQSGIVFRIGGLKFDSKDLYLRAGSGAERRVRLLQAPDGTIPLDALDWRRLALVVFATGYRPRHVPFFDQHGHRLALRGDTTGTYVDGAARLIAADGNALPGVFAIGMCSGFLPMAGGLGGEPSFSGLANSVLLCHGRVGGMIFDALMSARTGTGPGPHMPAETAEV